MSKLKRTLGLTEAVFFGTGSILGAGIYAIVGKVAGHQKTVQGSAKYLQYPVALCSGSITDFVTTWLFCLGIGCFGVLVFPSDATTQKKCGFPQVFLREIRLISK